MGSVKSRKVSTQSLQSTTSADDTPVVLSTFVNIDDAAAASTAAAAAAAAGPDILTDDVPETQTDLRDTPGDDLDYCHNMPWIKVTKLRF